MKVVVKAMEVVGAQGDAIRISCDQSRVPGMPPRRTATRPGQHPRARGGGGLTRSRTEESFAKDCNDRLLSEYRLGWSEASFEFCTWDVTKNRG